MALTSGVNASTLAFVVDALRTAYSPTVVNLTIESHRQRLGTDRDILQTNGHRAIRNSDGSGMTIAQIATAANLTTAQVIELAGKL